MSESKIRTPPVTKAYEEGWERIFNKKEPICIGASKLITDKIEINKEETWETQQT
jgi:hypothetical protein